MARINARTINEKLKLGWTANQIAGHFGMEEVVFLQSVEKTFGESKAKEFLSRMEKNEKRVSKAKKSLSAHKLVSVETAQQVDTTCSKVDSEEPSAKAEQLEDVSSNDIFQLESKAIQLSDEIIQLEKEHAAICSRKNVLRNKCMCEKDALAELYKKFEALQNDLRERRDVIFSISEEIDNLTSQASSISEKISVIRRDLDKVHAEILEAKKVYIFASKDGAIELEDESSVEPDGWETFYDYLLDTQEAESLTIKQVKQLAKLLKYTETLRNQGLIYEVTFDSQELEIAFLIITEK